MPRGGKWFFGQNLGRFFPCDSELIREMAGAGTFFGRDKAMPGDSIGYAKTRYGRGSDKMINAFEENRYSLANSNKYWAKESTAPSNPWIFGFEDSIT